MYKIDYDEKSPITGKMSVLVEYDPQRGDTVKMCMDTGYQTLVDTFTNKNPEFSDIRERLPAAAAQSEIIDENGNYWYRLIIQVGNKVLHPNVNGSTQVWVLSQLVEASLDEDLSFITVDSEDKQVVLKLDESTQKVYQMDEYATALNDLMGQDDNLNEEE